MNGLMIRTRRLLPPFLLLIAGVLLCLLLGVIRIPSASAADASNFDPGHIIDDTVFYNSTAMTSSQIQNFLNAKVPNCDTNGTQPATDWGRSDISHATLASYIRNGTNGYTKDSGFHAPPYTCLKDFKQNTPQMEAASGLCSSLSARTNRTAAQIINDVARACGINPQVFVVLLQKEMSLVTDNWPLNRQYKNATGFACPDTAPCDPKYNGFFYQVYYAARQFMIYKKYANDFNYIAGRTNRIYWHPDLSRCGSSQVYIQNQATAALYIYTPYRPNQAALDNLYGTGNSCSSYGNRNFWRLFTDWFGSTIRPGEVAITARYNALNSDQKTKLGTSTSVVRCNLIDNGCYQTYTNGAIIWSSQTGAWESYGPTRTRWLQLGTEAGDLGYPTGALSCGLVNDGCWQRYQRGYMVWSQATGAWESKGGIRTTWQSAGAETGNLGYPTGPEVAYNGGWYQKYVNGYIVGKVSTGFWISSGDIRTRWVQLGAETGSLGYPLGATACGLADGGCWQRYEKGYIVQSSATGAWESKGGIRSRWVALNAENGTLGYPSGPETAYNGGWFQKYENGYIIGRNSTGYWESAGDIRTRWVQLGAETGSLGYPMGAVACGLTDDGCWQRYQHGYIVWSDATGAWESKGAIRTRWVQSGSESGSLGYPTGPIIQQTSSTSYQTYQGGRIYFTLPNTTRVE